MGDFNAHFSGQGVELDHKASFLLNMSNMLGLNAELVASGVRKFAWSSRRKKSTLDLHFNFTMVARMRKESSH